MENKTDSFKPTILLVEDEPETAQRISESFNVHGFNILKMESLKDINTSISNNDIDLVMVDLSLSEIQSETHKNFVGNIKSISDIPLIAYSSYKWEKPERHEDLSYFDELFTKTKDPNQNIDNVLNSIKELISNRSSKVSENGQKSQDPNEIPSSSVIKIETIDSTLYSALKESPELLKTLDWRIFEELLADILDTFGYEVELKQGTKDGGIDIIAISKSEDWGIQKYLLQAKRWKNRVGVEPVQQLMFLHSAEHATKSCLATTSTFTSGAWKIRNQYQWQLELRDFYGIQEWINRAWKIKFGI